MDEEQATEQLRYTRACPNCDREIRYKVKKNFDLASANNTFCVGCRSRISKAAWTDEEREAAKEKMRQSHAKRTLAQKRASQLKRNEKVAAWSEERRQAFHDQMSAVKREQNKGESNPFFGKRHSEKSIARFKAVDRSYTKTAEFAAKVKEALVGVDTSCNLKAIWFARGGQEEVNRCEKQRREKISARTSGKNNPMFGKPRPAGGNGWKGYYKSWFFRSLLELSYVVNVLEPSNLTWESAERKEFEIPWIDWKGTSRTYRADFLVSGSKLVECKPKRLHSTPQVEAKRKAAEIWCSDQGFEYELICPSQMTLEQLKELCNDGNVVLTDGTKRKLARFEDAPVCHDDRHSS